MKKIVFATIAMQMKSFEPKHYVCSENPSIEYSGNVRYPINGVLAKTLKKDDDVKIVRIITECEQASKNANFQKNELEEINANIGAKIEYIDVVAPFKETSDIVESRFKQIIHTLEEGCTILADMTYGPKTLIPLIFFALGFAEKFFDAEISHIVYGKTSFDNTKTPDELYDVTPLFYLNSLTSVMEAPDGKTALARLDKFFEL